MVNGTLAITKELYGWSVDWSDTPEAYEIRGLFGTTKVPTPFTPNASFETVRDAIQALNPEYTVE